MTSSTGSKTSNVVPKASFPSLIIAFSCWLNRLRFASSSNSRFRIFAACRCTSALSGLSCFGDVIEDLGDAKDADRSDRKPGEPAYDVSDGLEAGRIGLLPSLGIALRAEVFDGGNFRLDSREGLASREIGVLTSTQLALISSPIPFSRCIFFAARGGVV